jgi:hypothetical protein
MVNFEKFAEGLVRMSKNDVGWKQVGVLKVAVSAFGIDGEGVEFLVKENRVPGRGVTESGGQECLTERGAASVDCVQPAAAFPQGSPAAREAS